MEIITLISNIKEHKQKDLISEWYQHYKNRDLGTQLALWVSRIISTAKISES